MDINFKKQENFEQPPKEKDTKKTLLITILVFLILTFIVNSLILADAIHTKYVTYTTLGSLVAGDNTNDKKASTQGNLGNFNVASKKNSLADNQNGTYTLTIEAEFTNYGDKGRSFNEAVDVTAYQDDKEIKSGGFEGLESGGEADVKVRNGQCSNVILTYTLNDNSLDVNIDMTAGNNEFTYTVKLGGAQEQKQEENKDAQDAQNETEAAKENTENKEEKVKEAKQ